MTAEPPRPELDAGIEVLAGTDVTAAWDRFEVFEALHHSMVNCNPMTTLQLGELVGCLDIDDGHRVLDVACGYGELLLRAGTRRAVQGIGVDLSPWMITRAHARAAQSDRPSSFHWILGEARGLSCDPVDVAVCIGAEWVWHDFRGTARALAKHAVDGGQVVIGAARLHHRADVNAVVKSHGVIDTIDAMANTLDEFDLEPTHRIDPDDAGWDAYLARTASAVAAWAERYPGERSERWVQDQIEWQTARERDRNIIGWSVWVASKRSHTVSV